MLAGLRLVVDLGSFLTPVTQGQEESQSVAEDAADEAPLCRCRLAADQLVDQVDRDILVVVPKPGVALEVKLVAVSTSLWAPTTGRRAATRSSSSQPMRLADRGRGGGGQPG